VKQKKELNNIVLFIVEQDTRYNTENSNIQ
jgi:hypothetical protein